MNWSMVRFMSSSTIARSISTIGFLRDAENVMWRSSLGVPNVSTSMSSVADANTRPALHSAAHVASAMAFSANFPGS